MVYKKLDLCSPEVLEKLSHSDGVFFRFHDPNRRMSTRTKSWGMYFESAHEAVKNGGTILDGKSCENSPEELMRWATSFDNSYIVIAFYGHDTRKAGHDGETVATYYKKLKAFSYGDFCKCFKEDGWKWALAA